MDKRALAVLIACFFTIFTAYAIRYSYGVILPEMLPSLAISKTEAGVIYSSFFIAYTVLSPVLGFMGNRYNMRILLPLFVAMLGAGTFLMAFSSSIIEASLSFALAGIGTVIAPIIAGWIGDTTGTLTWSFVLAAGGAVISLCLLLPVWRMSSSVLPRNQ